MANADEEVLESLNGEQEARLVLIVSRLPDRLQHVVVWQEGETRVELLRSYEGSPDDPWPPSPPLQQLHVERQAGARVALEVGMAGRNHWSQSIEPLGDRLALRFDSACRLQSPPQRLGHTWRCADILGQPQRHSPHALVWRLAGGELIVTTELGDGVVVPGHCDERAGMLRIEPAAEETASPTATPAGRVAPRTVRWRFEVAWRGSGTLAAS